MKAQRTTVGQSGVCSIFFVTLGSFGAACFGV